MTAPLPPVAEAAMAAAGLATELGRNDLSARLTAAATRVVRPATVVCIVGEYKQGKSSLVNALLGQQACPVDDDLATATLMLLRHGDTVKVTVRRKDGESTVVEDVAPAALRSWVTESGNPNNERGVERVDVALPHPLLATGLILVDTPGMGSMGAGHAANTLAFLPFADGLVFVSDASAELSAPEVEFLAQARDLCPNVVLALTKTDLYPEWRRIEALDAQHVSGDLALPTVALSSPVRALALARQDARLDERSGFPELAALLQSTVVGPAKSLAMSRAVVETRGALDQLEQPLRSELAALDDPAGAAATAAQLQSASARLEHLRGPGARWSTVVSDRVADLGNDVTFRFRGHLRELTRTFDEAIEELSTSDDWDELARRLQTEVASVVTEVFQSMARGGESIADAVVELLGEDAVDLPPLRAGDHDLDIAALWGAKGVDERGSRAARGFTSAMTGLRGAQGGILMFGMMGRFLPAGAAAIMLSNPITLGLGLAFGGMQLIDSHKRKITLRRQMARANVRQFLDDVQFEVSNAIGEALRELPRTLRDEFGARVGELQRTYADAARAAQESAQAGQAAATQRRPVVTASLARVGALRAQLDSAGAA